MIRRAILAATLLSGMVLAAPAGALAQALPTDRSELAYSYAPLVKRRAGEALRQHTPKTGVVDLYEVHGVVDELADVRLLGVRL